MKNLILVVSLVCSGGLTRGVQGDPERNQPGFGVSNYLIGHY